MTYPQSHILLDPVGDAIVPEGYRVVETEVEFLRYALSSENLLIRNRRLCEWAERFYQGRGIEFRHVESPSRTLQRICPQLNERQAQHLAERLISKGHVPQHDWSVTDVLSRLHPEARWFETLNAEHAAWWLLWLQERPLSDAEQVLLRQQSEIWAQSAEEVLKPIYTACDASSAQSLMEEWLCLVPHKRLDANLPSFPAPLPDPWKRRLRDVATEWYVHEEEQAWNYMERRVTGREAKCIVADVGATYYQCHPHLLTRDRLQRLSPYLTVASREQLERLVPPPEPSPLNAQQSPEAILRWATEQYLPYRRWAMQYGNDEQRETTEQLAQRFIRWLLEFYPRALLGDGSLQRVLVFRQVRKIRSPDRVTFLVVLDGLGWQDALDLHARVMQIADRLTPLEPQPMLGALPTITPFAKPAILRGECPRFALDEQQPAADIGEVLPEGNIPSERLSQAEPGECLIWRVNEPDKTYHERYNADTLAHDIQAELDNLAKKIVEAVRAIPFGIPKQIVVTSDHGRLFGYSHRRHQPPAGMQAKGRAAWGDCNLRFDERGYWLNEESGLLYLHAERFGLTHHVAVPLDTDMFLTEGGKGGGERYAHGGVHPEEVIVPWLTYVQDVRAPRLRCQAIVSGQVGRDGTLRLEITNLEEHLVRVNNLQLLMSGQEWYSLPVQREIKALSTDSTDFVLPKLPTKAQWKQVQAGLEVIVDAISFEVDVAVIDETREMYRKTDLLEELQ